MKLVSQIVDDYTMKLEPVCVMIWEGMTAIAVINKMIKVINLEFRSDPADELEYVKEIVTCSVNEK